MILIYLLKEKLQIFNWTDCKLVITKSQFVVKQYINLVA